LVEPSFSYISKHPNTTGGKRGQIGQKDRSIGRIKGTGQEGEMDGMTGGQKDR